MQPDRLEAKTDLKAIRAVQLLPACTDAAVFKRLEADKHPESKLALALLAAHLSPR